MDGQAPTAPVDEFAGLVDLLLHNPDSDAAQDRQSDGTVIEADGDAAALDLLQQRETLPSTEEDNLDDDLAGADEANARSLDTFDPGESLSPNGGRRIGLQPREGDGRFAPARQGEGQFRVTVRDAAGKETTQVVDEKERAAGYLRHEDYSRKTAELANQRHQAVTILDKRLADTHKMALDAVHKAQAVVVSLANLPTAQQLAEMAVRDPAGAMTEKLRIDAVNAQFAHFDQMAAQIQAKAVADAKDAQQQRFDICFAELEREGKNGVPMSREQVMADLTPLFESVIATFGIPRERFAFLDDPKLIRIMRKAMKMVELEKLRDAQGKPTATPVARTAASNGRRVPPQRQAGSASSRANKDLDSRFARREGGRVDDLARWMLNNGA